MFRQEDVSVGEWFVFKVLSAIPVVNIIVWLILLLGPKTNKSLKNFMILQLILFVLIVIIIVIFWGVLIAIFDNMN